MWWAKALFFPIRRRIKKKKKKDWSISQLKNEWSAFFLFFHIKKNRVMTLHETNPWSYLDYATTTEQWGAATIWGRRETQWCELIHHCYFFFCCCCCCSRRGSEKTGVRASTHSCRHRGERHGKAVRFLYYWVLILLIKWGIGGGGINIGPVAPVAYQVIFEPDIGQFRECELPRVHTLV